MCDPVTLTTLGMSASAASTTALTIQGVSAAVGTLSTVAGIASTNKAASQNAQSSLDAYHLKTRLNNQRLGQEQVQASQAKMDNDLRAMKAQGTAISAAAGGGVQGRDIDRLLNDFERSEGMMANRIDQKLDAMADQAAVENLGFQSEAINRINSQQPIGFAEGIFKIADPIMGFGVDYYDTKARYAALEPKE